MKDIESYIYDIDPVFQRNYTKKRAWEENMVSHIVWTRQAGSLYFHPRERVSETGENFQVYECVDGKSRSNAIRNFMKDDFTVKDCGYPYLEGVVFSKWPLADKGWFQRITINIATCDRTLSDNEITKLFKNLKTPSDCKTGELLNSKRNSPLLIMYLEKRESRPDFAKFVDEFWGRNKRYASEEMIAGLAHMIENTDDKLKPIPSDKHSIWESGLTSLKFDKLIEYALAVGEILIYARVKQRSAGTVFFPFFRLFVLQTDASVIQTIKMNIDRNVFTNMRSGGDAHCVQERYEHLLYIAEQ